MYYVVVAPSPIHKNVNKWLLADVSCAKGVVLIHDDYIRLEVRTKPYK